MPSTTTNSLNFLYLNSQSLRNSINDLQDFLDSLSYDIHIICVTETWLTNNEAQFYNLRNYTAYHSFRSNGRGGGAAIYVLNSFDNATLAYENDFFGNNIIVIKLLRLKIKIACCYRKPNNQDDSDASIFRDILDSVISKHNSAYFFGDFNINLLDKTAISANHLNTFNSNGFQLLNSLSTDFPTRFGYQHQTSSCIDHIFTDRHYFQADLQHELSYFDLIGDHRALFLSISSNSISFTPNRGTSISIVDHRKIVNDKLIENIETESFTDFVQSVNLIIESNTITKTLSAKRDKPFINKHILTLISIRNRYQRLSIKFPTLLDLRYNYNKYRKLVISSVKKAKYDYNQQQFQQNADNPKKIWQNINRLMYNKEPSNSNNISEIKLNGISITNQSTITNSFNDYFVHVAENVQHNNTPINNTINISPVSNEAYTITQALVCAPCSHDEIDNLITNLNNSTAVDFFGISNNFLKIHKNAFIPILTKLINRYLFAGIFPEVLKIAVIKPIHKNGDVCQMSNYRPISLLPIFGKVFEKVIYRRLYQHISENSILHANQFGYVEKSNTEIAAIHLLNEVYKGMDENKATSLTCIDLSKAFDCVNINTLKSKLSKLGLSTFFFNLLCSYLSDRKQVVKINDTLSQILDIISGIPQGGTLSGLLFIIYINSLGQLSLSGYLAIYCDDISIVNTAHDPTSLKIAIENDLSLIDQWLNIHQLTPNRSKSNYILFHNRRRNEVFINRALNISFGSHIIKRVESIKYLGLIIDEELIFDRHIDSIIKKVTPYIFAIKRIRQHLSDKTAISLYHAYINSRFSYMNKIWCVSLKSKIESIEVIQRKALRIILKKSWYCSRSELYSQSIIPISLNALLATNIFVFKIIHNSVKNNVNINVASDRHDHLTRMRDNLVVSRFKTVFASKNIYVRGVQEFNAIPNNIKNFNSLAIFRKRLKEYYLETL